MAVSGVLRRAGELPTNPGFRRWAVRLSLVALGLVVVGLAARATGESTRTTATVAAAKVELEREIRADCDFKFRVANLPRLSEYPSRVVVDLANSARTAYIEKRCEKAGHGPPPPVYTARPSPTAAPSRPG